MTAVQFPVARKLLPMLKPARYKGLYGGRAGMKSHFFASCIAARALSERTRAACIREVQNTLRESSYQVISDKIHLAGVESEFELQRDRILCPHDGQIVFRGMQDANAENVKSLEDFDVAYWEEAQTAKQKSFNILRPTIIRKPSAELWFAWNPRFDTDPVDQFFRGPNGPPENSICIRVGWEDNPWISDEFRAEILADYAKDEEEAKHIWGGEYENVSEAAYYARLMASVEQEGRLGHFPYRHNLPVITAWDIGVDDYTAIWFLQEDGERVDVIDYFETQNEGAPEIVATALPEYHEDIRAAARQLVELGRDRPWRYQEHFLPHDVKVREWGAGARTRVEVLMGLGLKNIRKGVAASYEDQHAAVRALLPLCRFNDTPRVRLGMRRLKRYGRKRNEQLGIFMGPLHDEHSHGASAFAEYALNCPLTEKQRKEEVVKIPPGHVVLPGPPEPKKGVRIRL